MDTHADAFLRKENPEVAHLGRHGSLQIIEANWSCLHQFCLENVDESFWHERALEFAFYIFSHDVRIEVVADSIASRVNKMGKVVCPECLLLFQDVVSHFQNHEW